MTKRKEMICVQFGIKLKLRANWLSFSSDFHNNRFFKCNILHNGFEGNICNIGKDFSLLFSVFQMEVKERAMKKNMLRIMATVTIMGGLLASTNVPNVKAEEYPEMIVFDDVPVNYWAYDDIMDVVYNKVMLGYGNGKFGVGDNVTREQVAAVLYRTLNLKRKDL